MVKLPAQATFVFLVLATISYPADTLAQTPSNPTQIKPQTRCVSGYPDGTYRGDRPMTRYEFAAGLNACLEGVDRLLPRNRDDLATREDFDALIQRQQELNQQLRELNQRVGDRSE